MGDLKKFEAAPFEEAPREDVLEQQQEDQAPAAEDDQVPDEEDAPVPLEANEADAAEQRLEVGLDEDEYR
ncbi:hypothetical protein [Actinocorallia aurantiaca]|jgi:hypothetical protein|uniref:Uncharacterized protein n=1 Tax=Actinocorallia aurantiaca TaxID=46204 RepID=A0ABN3U332_9ACTN